MRNPKVLCLFVLLMILLTACNVTSPTTVQPNITLLITTDTPDPSVGTTYPIEDSSGSYVGTIYPLGQEPTGTAVSPESGGPTPEPQKTPVSDADTASIFGVLYSYSDELPLQGVKVYAADVVVIEPSGGKVYTTQEKSSPQAATDEIGQFMITGIKPGTYYFMMVTPFGNYPIFDSKNQTFEMELKGGDVINFGEVYVNWP